MTSVRIPALAGAALFVLGAVTSCEADHAEVRDAEAAARLVEERVRQDGAYDRSGLRVDCLSFEPSEDASDPQWPYAVEIREIHQGKCASEGVDPVTAPRVDTFYVSTDGTLYWFDSTAEDDMIRPYREFLAERRGGP